MQPDTQPDKATSIGGELGRFVLNDKWVVLSNDFDAIKPHWLALQEKAAITIYQHYYWQKAWYETLGQAEAGQALFILVLESGQAELLIPLVLVKKHGLTLARFMGADHANYKFPLLATSAATQYNSALTPQLLAALKKNLPFPVDVLELTGQPLAWEGIENPVARKLRARASATNGSSVSLTPDFNALLQRGNAKRKRKILRAQERLLDQLGGYRLMRTKTASDNASLYDIFVEQKRPWFDERGIKDKFSAPQTRAFFNRLAAYNEFLPEGERLIDYDWVDADGQPLALLAGGTFKGQHFGYFTSMHPAEKYAPISPGALIFYKKIEQSCAEGYRRFDFGIGAERYKISWCDENHPLVDVMIATSLPGYVYTLVQTVKLSLKRRIKQNEKIWELAKNLRRRLAGQSILKKEESRH